MLAESPQIDLLSITVVAGNQTLATNALNVPISGAEPEVRDADNLY